MVTRWFHSFRLTSGPRINLRVTGILLDLLHGRTRFCSTGIEPARVQRGDNHANNVAQNAHTLLREDPDPAFCTDRDACFSEATCCAWITM